MVNTIGAKTYLDGVRSLSPRDRLLYWIKERERIRKDKESGKPKPWTNDPILQSYRFCNVRRMDDKVSRWLYDNWYKPHFNHSNMLVACTIARHFNKPEALGPITKAVFAPKYSPEAVLNIIQGLKAKGVKVFSAAYMIHADQSADKSEMVINRVVQPLYKTPPRINTDSMEESVKALLPCWNIGSFMAGQIIADMRWAVKGGWKDKNTWAAIGPGSRKGMNLYQGRPENYPLEQEQFNDELMEQIAYLKPRLGPWANRLEAIDWQNCNCEFFKYSKALGGNRLKQRYEGANS